MRTVKFQMLRPFEILEEKKRCPIVYLPIGPLEWHGPHLPLGMDPLNAEAVSLRVAQNVGGVVLPTFYWGTERERSPEMLRNIGFNGDEWIVGMDFPANPMPSLYFPEDVFGIAVREYVRLLIKHDYKLIVIINGHGADNHIRTLQRIAAEFTAETDATVMYTITTFLSEDGEQDFGHATKVETSIMSYLYPECVDLDALPPRGEPIYNTDFAVVDDAAFRGNPNENYSVCNDPRDASQELGKETMESSVRIISKKVREAWEELRKTNA